MTIHINIPQSIESFVQEAGRAGRDGKVSASVILFNNDS
jgi:superfamily II DNA helicase RecQ